MEAEEADHERRAALDWAASVRRARTDLRDALGSGRVHLPDVLEQPGELVAGVTVQYALESLPGARKVDTRRRLADLGLDPATALEDLTPEVRSVLTATFPLERR